MSCRVGGAADHAAARAVAWRRAEEGPGGEAAGPASPAELEMAREESRALAERLEQLEQSLGPLRKQAWDEGFRAGRAEAHSALQQELDAERACFAQAVAYMLELRTAWRKEIENDAVALAMAVARRILNREIAVDVDAVQAIVRVALEKTGARELRRVRVAPGQAESVRGCLAVEAPGVELVADPALAAGDVRLEMAQGALDASVTTQLEEIERGLADPDGR
jgi:flagellar assembly protein FliH